MDTQLWLFSIAYSYSLFILKITPSTSADNVTGIYTSMSLTFGSGLTAEPPGTAEPESEPTGTAEPESEPTGTAEPESEPTGTAEPESEPTGTAEAESAGTAEPESEPTGTAEPESEPTGTAEPESEPTGTAEPESEPTWTAEPESEPTGTAEPESEPTGTAEPESEPTGTAEPESEPTGTAEPESEPTGTAEPESEPTGTAEPESEPTGTAEPESEPTGTAEPESEPTGTAEPESEPTGTAEPVSEPNGTAEPESAPSGTSEPISELSGSAEPSSEIDPSSEPEVETEPIAEVRPTSLEILLPPFLLCVAIVGALIWLVVARYKPCSRSYRKVWVSSFNKAKLRSVLKIRSGFPPGKDTSEKEHPPLMSTFDVEVLGSLRTFYNKPRELVRIATPALLSLALCPVTLYLYEPLVAALWPDNSLVMFPDINDAIACFLSPAGLVYATSFGFAFQQALSKQHEVLVHVTEELSKIDQIATLTSKLSLPSLEDRLEIYRAIKAEIIFMILQIEQRAASSFCYQPTEDIKVKIWSVLDILRKVPIGERTHYMDRMMCEKIVNHITCINSICSDRMGTIHSRIHPLKWAFLETLGFFSFLGVLLLQAGGYRMELAMCIITVFSISMLCYVVSDLDSPFSGFFRVDLSVFPDVIHRLEIMYNNAIQGNLSVVPYPEPTKDKKKSTKIKNLKTQTPIKTILITPSKTSEI